jgi:hypothetical protein
MTSLPLAEGISGQTANQFRKGGIESEPRHRGRSNASMPIVRETLQIVSRNSVISYIYIGVSQRRVDALLRKRPSAVLNATEVLWPHDVRICIAVRKIPFSLAMLYRVSYISSRSGNNVTSPLFSVEKRVLIYVST